MKKERPIQNYIHFVQVNEDFFKRYYYHSIVDLNLIKLDSILTHGILSKSKIEQKQCPKLYTHPSNTYDSKNGMDYVSLTEYQEEAGMNPYFASFPLHTLTSPSLLVDKEIPVERQGERDTILEDEVFCYEEVPLSMIRGILLPEHLSTMPISKVGCLANDLSCYTRSYMENWIDSTEKYFDKTISKEEIYQSLQILWEMFVDCENPSNVLSYILENQQRRYGEDIKDVLARIQGQLWEEKLGISNPTYLEVLQAINQERYPIYEIKKSL